MSGIRLPCHLPLPYSDELCSEYECVAAAVVDQVFEVYDQFRAHPTLDARTWKLAKTRGAIQIYYARERDPASALHKPLPAVTASAHVRAQADWSPMVKLLVTGTMRGSLDDAMYGAVSTTDLSALMKSMTIRDDFYHHKTLRHIKVPTVDAPFTYVGLRWNAWSSYMASLIKARDMVFVESSGFRDVRTNDGNTSRRGILRAKYSACVLFRQQSPGIVEVFSTTSLQPAGDLLFKVTAFQAAEALIAVCNVTESAMKKKLVWMQAARAYGTPNATTPYLSRWRAVRHSVSGSFKTTCVLCESELRMLKKTFKCEICTAYVCSRCMTSCKFVFGYTIDELEYRATPTCKACIATAMHNAQALAVYEFVQPFEYYDDTHHNSAYNASSKRRYSLSLGSATDLSVDGLSLSTSHTMHECDTPHGDHTTDHASESTTKRVDEMIPAERRRLWEQINILCAQADDTHRLAERQTRVMQQQQRLYYEHDGTASHL